MPDYTTYKVEDLLMDEGFLEYCKGNNPDAVKSWQDFVGAHPEMAGEIDEAKKLYQTLSVTTSVEEKNEALSRLKAGITSEAAPVYQLTGSRKINWRKYAAAAAIVGILLSSLLWYNFSTGKQEPAIADFTKVNFKEIIRAGNDQRKEWQLSDGSVVLLNYGSVLKVADNYNQSERWLYLEGEAFFSVTKNAQKPFVVITSKTATTALGTSFKVRSYPGEDNGSVMLATGKVKVESLVTSATVKADMVLLPGEAAAWAKSEQPVKSNFDQQTLLDWRNATIILEKADLAKITAALEFYYGVQVNLENKPRIPIAFTGKFYAKSLKDVLEAIAFTNKFNYSQKGNTVSIRFR